MKENKNGNKNEMGKWDAKESGKKYERMESIAKENGRLGEVN